MALVGPGERRGADHVSELPLGERLALGGGALGRIVTRVEPLRGVLNLLGRLPVSGRTGVIAVPYLWLGLFFLLPDRKSTRLNSSHT